MEHEHGIPSGPQSRERIVSRLKELLPNGCKRILFVNPLQLPEEDLRLDVAMSRRYFCFPPYGPGLLVAAAKSRGYEADILDLNYRFLKHAAEAGQESTLDRQVIWNWLVEEVNRFKPDLVAVSCMFTMAHLSMCRIAETIKSKFPQIPVMGGGVHITNDTENILRGCPAIDFAMRWESDSAFPSLLDYLNGNAQPEALAQLAAIENGEYLELPRESLVTAQDLDRSPDYGSLDLGAYNRYGRLGAYEFLHGNKPASTVLSNRGCRARCTFCSVRQFNGAGVRGRDIVSVIDEVEHLVADHGIRHLMWLDDDLLYNPSRALDLFQEIARRNLGITWDASNGLIAAAITHELMQAMVASGCIGFHLGLESGDSEILRKVKKPGTVETYLRAGEILRAYPQVFVKGYLIIGFPHETVKQLLNTVDLAVKMELGWYPVSILTPLPSTEIYTTMKEQGLLEDGGLEGSRNMSFSNTDAKQRVIEEKEKVKASDFMNLFTIRNPNYVPTKQELRDFWFLMDYRVNYEKLVHLKDLTKVGQIARMLEEVCDRITKDNALGNLFLGVALSRLGDHEGARKRAVLAEKFASQSEYWQRRFEALDLYKLLAEVKSSASVPPRKAA